MIAKAAAHFSKGCSRTSARVAVCRTLLVPMEVIVSPLRLPHAAWIRAPGGKDAEVAAANIILTGAPAATAEAIDASFHVLDLPAEHNVVKPADRCDALSAPDVVMKSAQGCWTDSSWWRDGRHSLTFTPVGTPSLSRPTGMISIGPRHVRRFSTLHPSSSASDSASDLALLWSDVVSVIMHRMAPGSGSVTSVEARAQRAEQVAFVLSQAQALRLALDSPFMSEGLSDPRELDNAVKLAINVLAAAAAELPNDSKVDYEQLLSSVPQDQASRSHMPAATAELKMMSLKPLNELHRAGILARLMNGSVDRILDPGALKLAEQFRDELKLQAKEEAEKRKLKEKKRKLEEEEEAEKRKLKEKKRKLEEEEEAKRLKEEAKSLEEEMNRTQEELEPSLIVLEAMDDILGVPSQAILQDIADELIKSGEVAAGSMSDYELIMKVAQREKGLPGIGGPEAKFSAEDVGLMKQSDHEPARWITWPSATDRTYAMGAVAVMGECLFRPEEMSEVNGRVLLGPRGTGKTTILRIGALTLGVVSHALASVDKSRKMHRVIPVMMDFSSTGDFLSAIKNDGVALALRDFKLLRFADRALQLAGLRPRVEASNTLFEFDQYPWIRSYKELNAFLRKNSIKLMFVMDEVDMMYKMTTKLAFELLHFAKGGHLFGYVVSGSAAWMRMLLFEPFAYREDLKAAGYDQDALGQFPGLHNQKLNPMLPLQATETFEEFEEAIDAIGRPPEGLAEVWKAHKDDPEDVDAQLALAEGIISRGGVMRTWMHNPASPQHPDKSPISLDKMIKDALAEVSDGRRAVYSAFVDRLRESIKGLQRETVSKELVRRTKANGLGKIASIRQSTLISKIRESGDSSSSPQVILSSMADSGILTFESGMWHPASWTSVATMLECVDDRSGLTNKQRIALMHPTIGKDVTEPTLTYAFAGMQAQDYVILGGEHHRSVHGLAKMLNEMRSSWLEGNMIPVVKPLPSLDQLTDLQAGVLYRPVSDKGVDMVFFTPVDSHDGAMWQVSVQLKAGSLDKNGKHQVLKDVKEIVPRFGVHWGVHPGWGDEELKTHFKADSIRHAYVIATNKHAPVGLKSRASKLSRALRELQKDIKTPSNEKGKVMWIGAFGDQLRKQLPPDVLEWGRAADGAWCE